MSLPYYSISSNSYKCNLCTGFTQLQKNEEFTDLTLAADGHIIHVHKNIIALASPYLRAMLKSIPSQSPVIFLNNVSHKVLSHLLEYIYQGEVNVPADTLDEFIQITKSLHIVGIEDMLLPRKETLLAEPTAESSGEGYACFEFINELNTHSVVVCSLCRDFEQVCASPMRIEHFYRPSNIAAHISIGNDHTMQIEPYPRGGDLSNVINLDEPDSAVECLQDMKPKEVLLPKPPVNSSEGPSHIAAHISIGNDRTMQIQSYPHNDINSEIVEANDGAFKEKNPETVVNETHDLPIINTDSDAAEDILSSVATRKKFGGRKKIKRLTRRKYSSRINTPQNVKINGTTQNIPAIEIHKDNSNRDQNLETAPRQYHDYNFIVKKQYDTEQDPLATTNTPVIEIQPIIVESQDKQTNAIPVLVDTAQYELVTDQDNIQIQKVNKDQIASNPDQNLQPMVCQDWDQDITKIKIIREQIIHTETLSSNTALAPDAKISSDAAEEPLQSVSITDMTDFKGLAQFSTSERGVLQLILNRYIYNCHHTARGGNKRRFRCIAYRMGSCPAFVDTLHGAIVARKGMHNHPYHDETLSKKHKKGLIFLTMKQAADVLDRKQYR